jgi:hypothetical protein
MTVEAHDSHGAFRPKKLAKLSTTGSPRDSFEIVMGTRGGTERHFVERKSFGGAFAGTRERLNPD